MAKVSIDLLDYVLAACEGEGLPRALQLIRQRKSYCETRAHVIEDVIRGTEYVHCQVGTGEFNKYNRKIANHIIELGELDQEIRSLDLIERKHWERHTDAGALVTEGQ